MKVLITGGSGFIGSAMVRHLIEHTECKVLNYDLLTYAGNPDSLVSIASSASYHFVQGDIRNAEQLEATFTSFQPDAVMHLAAESHVDRSIDGPADFIETNINGTFVLLEASRKYLASVDGSRRANFRFHHISTDEVYGDLAGTSAFFTEETSYNPSSPYSASKAASDHLVRAWSRTYGLPVLITNCSNNYGPYQFPEKLIPHMILNALAGKALPIYGDGQQIRDWLYVEDHARALWEVLTKGEPGATYNIGGHNEKTNLEVCHALCDLLSELIPDASPGQYRELIKFVEDRPGHDLRYAIDASKIAATVGWTPQETFETGLRRTVEWYLNNQSWWQRVLDGSYKLERIGA